MENTFNVGLNSVEDVTVKKQGLGIYRAKIGAFTNHEPTNQVPRKSPFGTTIFANKQAKALRMNDGGVVVACCCSFGGADNIKND
ncbi:hypothetical protein HU830_06375 [Lactobacillus sp. DCY120]|uniref:Uncharacterized protein n=1 Tax=Bombilactobacillus apium TaxID=2675299 RepID=A0A850R119_9LACO|nr:hypothetical protein [Bombilactobacillus apium]NVY96779.1 hypothetical protein [Bombilactobacillus apium]